MNATTNRTASDTRYLVCATDDARKLALSTDRISVSKDCRHECTLEMQGMDASVSHIGRIEYTDGYEVYVWLQLGIKNGIGYATVYPQPRTKRGYIYPKYELGEVSSLREAAAIMAGYLSLAGCYLVHQQRTHTTDMVTY